MTDILNTKTTLRAEDLGNFIGTENWYKHSIYRRLLYTDGIQYVAEHGGAYWLIYKIFAAQYENINLPEQEFQVWKLCVNEDTSAILTCHDGDYNWQHEETITFTDFPLKEITFYFCNNVLLLPSEY